MTRDPRRNKVMDRLIGDSLRRGATEAGAGCPAPDLLAAYYDRSLSGAEIQQWESHFAGCLRCQRQLAALAHSETALVADASAALPSRLRLFDWRWMVPAVAAGTALALWIAVRPPAERPVEPIAPPQSASQVERPAARAEVGRDEAVNQVEPKQNPAPAGSGRRMARSDALQKKSENRATQEGRRAAAELASELRDKEMDKSVASAAPAATLPPRVAQPAAEEVTIARERAAVGGQVVADARSRDSASRITEIIAPGGAVRWRIGGHGTISRSRDGGQTWEPQASGVTADLVAGAAPSSSVCWIVGRTGTIVRTTDGERWETIRSPTAMDLIGVEAREALAATVTAVGGRRYSTDDGGRSWRNR